MPTTDFEIKIVPLEQARASLLSAVKQAADYLNVLSQLDEKSSYEELNEAEACALSLRHAFNCAKAILLDQQNILNYSELLRHATLLELLKRTDRARITSKLIGGVGIAIATFVRSKLRAGDEARKAEESFEEIFGGVENL